MTARKYLTAAITGTSFLGIAIVLVAWVFTHSHQPRYTLKNLPAADTAAVTTAQGSYLDLSKLGVELPLSSSISDAVYAPFNVSTDGAQSYGISTLSLMNASSDPGCQPAAGPLGIIVVTTAAPDTLTPTGAVAQLAPDNKTLFKFGSTYYHYVPPQNDACIGGSASTTTVNSEQTALAQSFTSLAADSSTATTTSTSSTQ